jgi:quercetin dioxygenase-like cupin family protein
MDLALLEDRLGEGERLHLGPAPCVVYAVSGAVDVEAGASRAPVEENTAWHGSEGCVIQARAASRLWRWELHPDSVSSVAAPQTTLKLRHTIEVPLRGALMRADRVDFPPNGIAYTHTHQGPGIRVLLRGRFRVETNGRVLELEPGAPWFERGPDPVYAEAIGDAPASFVRVMVLPVALLGKSSIRYVKPEDQARPKSQTYTVFVDAALSPHRRHPS